MSDRGRPDISIVTSGHDVADARLHRIVAALLTEDLDVEVLGLGDSSDAPAGVRVTTVPRPRLAKRALLAARWAAQARGQVLMALDPDSLLACLAVARLSRRAVVADVHEDYEALLRDRAWATGWRGRLGGVVARSASRAAAAADLVVVADDHVPPLLASHRVVTKNLPLASMLPAMAAPDEIPRAIYVGDVRDSRGLTAMVEAIALTADWRLDVVGPLADADLATQRERLAELGCTDRVTFHGRQPPTEAWKVARGAWCGLALLEDTPAFRDALPSKLYEYLACGLPAIVTDLPRCRALIEDTKAGEVVSSDRAKTALDTAEVLRSWSRDKTAYGVVRRAAQVAAEPLRRGEAYVALVAAVVELSRARSR